TSAGDRSGRGYRPSTRQSVRTFPRCRLVRLDRTPRPNQAFRLSVCRLRDLDEPAHQCRDSNSMPRLSKAHAADRAAATFRSDDERTPFLRCTCIHVSAAIEMIVDLGGGTDHAAVEKYIEGRRLKVAYRKSAGAVVLPEDRQQQGGDHRIDIDAEDVARCTYIVERLNQLAVEC